MSTQAQAFIRAVGFAALSGLFALAAPSALADDPQALATKYQCMNCHKVERKVVGPAFKDVAERYKGDAEALDRLTAKVRAGGKGVWGSAPMPPNKSIPDEDLKTVVNWILSLDS